MGNSVEAITIWKEGLNTPYTDAAGGVEVPATLLFAAVSVQDKDLEKEAIRLLKKRSRVKRAINNRQGFIEHINKCASSENGYLEQEYYLAIGELDRVYH